MCLKYFDLYPHRPSISCERCVEVAPDQPRSGGFRFFSRSLYRILLMYTVSYPPGSRHLVIRSIRPNKPSSIVITSIDQNEAAVAAAFTAKAARAFAVNLTDQLEDENVGDVDDRD